MTALTSIVFVIGLLFQQTPPPTGIPATFSGTFKMVEHGHIVVEVENGETMRMFVTRSTRFFRNGHPAKIGEFHDGDKVNVDAERDVRMNLLAVRVEAITQPPNKPK